MEQIIKDFVKEMFAISNIPHHEFAAPCSNYEWLDFGFRTKILGISNSRLNPLLNRRFMELPSYSVKPKFIDFIGFDDFIYLKNRAGSDGYRCIMYRTADKWV